jgi:hypothetical protein
MIISKLKVSNLEFFCGCYWCIGIIKENIDGFPGENML